MRDWRENGRKLLEKIKNLPGEHVVRVHPLDLADIFHHEIPNEHDHPFAFEHEQEATVHGRGCVADLNVKRGTVR